MGRIPLLGGNQHGVPPMLGRTFVDGEDRRAELKDQDEEEEPRGVRRDRIVAHSQIKRPDAREYHGGYEEEQEGYAAAGAASLVKSPA